MNNLKKVLLKLLAVFNIFIFTINNPLTVLATAPNNNNIKFNTTADQIKFPKIDAFLSGILHLLQYLAGGFALITIVLAGIKLFSSSDRSGTFEDGKFTVIKVLIGCAVVYSAQPLFDSIFTAVQP